MHASFMAWILIYYKKQNHFFFFTYLLTLMLYGFLSGAQSYYKSILFLFFYMQ